MTDRLRYIDVFNFCLSCKRFHELCKSCQEYFKRLRLSKEIVGYDHESLFDFLNKCFEDLQKDIEEGYAGTFLKRKHVFPIVRIKLKTIVFDLLPFKIFCHLFFCYRGASCAGK